VKPVTHCPPETLRRVQFFLSDIDGTLTDSAGRVSSSVVKALEKIPALGMKTLLVTGSSAGTALQYIRSWPIDAVVAESGALAFYRTSTGHVAAWYHSDTCDPSIQSRRDSFTDQVRQTVPEVKMAQDQFMRLFDVAFNCREDAPHLSQAAIDSIKQIARRLH